MSFVLSDEVKEVVYQKKRTLIGVECDECGKVIKPSKVSRDARYFRVMTGHYDWGNDSNDSIVYRDLCPTCTEQFVADYINSAKDTQYIRIDNKYVYKHDIDEGYAIRHNDGDIE